MKKHVKISKSLPILVFLISLIFFSCSKTSDINRPNHVGPDSTNLSINIVGIEVISEEEIKPGNHLFQTDLKTPFNNKDILNNSPILTENGQYEALIHVSEGAMLTEGKSTSALSVSPLAGSYPMEIGNTYRLLIYGPDNVLFSSNLAVSGTKLEVVVEKGITYTWIAYSYNDKEDIPEINNPNDPYIKTDIHRDFLYATGEIFFASDEMNEEQGLNILFKHKVSNIIIEVNARGMFTGLSDINMTPEFDHYFKKGDLYLKTGQVKNLSSEPGTVLNFSNKDESSKDSIQQVSLYTVDEYAFNNFKLNLNSFRIKLDNGDYRVFDSRTTVSFRLAPLHGKRVITAIDLVESALPVAGSNWARANLYYSVSDQAYRFRHINEPVYGMDMNEYWPYMTRFPHSSFNEIGSVDPCTLVYPQGLWKLPNIEESQRLIEGTNESIVHDDYIEFASSGNSLPYQNNNLRFYKLGYLPDAPSTPENLLDYQSLGRFWINKMQPAENPPLYYLEATDINGPAGNFFINTMWVHEKVNIRCIRSNPN